jgi:hypothetical protein
MEDHGREEVMDQYESYESIQLSDTGSAGATPSLMALEPHTTITGFVEEMFFSSKARNFLLDSSWRVSPPQPSDIPTDLDTEDGVPFGRSHHLFNANNNNPPRPNNLQNFHLITLPAKHFLLSATRHLGLTLSISTSQHMPPPKAQGSPATPPRYSPSMLQITPPLEEEVDDVTLLPRR